MANTEVLPIWRDTFCKLDYSQYGNCKKYRVINVENSETLFEGKIYWNNQDAFLKINDFAQDCFYYNTDFPSAATTKMYSDVHLNVQLNEGVDSWVTVGDYYFYYDYSYDEEDRNKISKSIQMSDKFDPRAYFLWTVGGFSNSNYKCTITSTDKSGHSTPSTIVGSLDSYTKSEYNPSLRSISVSVEFGGSQIENYNFTAENTCREYALYWINRYGGWQTYIITGKVTPKDSVIRNTYLHYVDNNLKRNFGNQSYMNEVTKQWQIQTGFFTDEQSKLFTDLYSSPTVYLHNLDTNEIWSVNVNDKSVDVKLTSNQKKSNHFKHNLTVEASQKQYRK